VSRPYSEGNGYSQVADNPSDYFLQRVPLIGGLQAVQHFSEDDAAYVIEMTA
jgi:hypothetical protein